MTSSSDITRHMIDAMPYAAAMFDNDLVYLYANKSWYQTYNCEAGLIGRHHYDVFPEIKNMPEWTESHKRTLSGRAESGFYDQLVREDGRTQSISWENFPWYDDKGIQGGIIMMTKDVTLEDERTRAQADAIHELEHLSASSKTPLDELFQKAVSLARRYLNMDMAFIGRIYGETYEILAAEIGGADENPSGKLQLLDTPCKITIEKDDLIAAPNIGQTFLAQQAFYEKVEFESYIGQCYRVGDSPYGTVSFASYLPRSKPFTRAEQMFVRFFAQWVSTQITRKVDLEKLKKSEQRYELAAIGSASAVWDWDVARDRIVWAGRSAEIFKVHDNIALPATSNYFTLMIHPEDRDRLKTALSVHFKTGAPFDIEIRVRNGLGRYMWMQARAQAVWDDQGQATRMCGTLTDITRRREIEDTLRQTNRELEEFASIASHDLKQPLRSISGFMELLKGQYADQLDEKAKEYVEYAINSADHMNELINDLLSYAHMGRGVMHHTHLDLNDIFEMAKDGLKDFIKAQNADIECETLPKITGDENQIYRLFINLMENGMKYAHPDRPPILSITPEISQGWCHIYFKDNGIGIPEDKLEKIFGMFERLHDQSTYPGTGIGLAICKRIANNHLGDISVQSKPGEGAVFKVSLPVDFKESHHGDEGNKHEDP